MVAAFSRSQACRKRSLKLDHSGQNQDRSPKARSQYNTSDRTPGRSRVVPDCQDFFAVIREA
jgi:hypothetical protein